MVDKHIFFLGILGSILCGRVLSWAAPQMESPAMQEVRLSLQQVNYHLRSQEVDLSLFQERMLSLENMFSALKQDLEDKGPADTMLERRIVALEKANEALLLDSKTFKTHLNETAASLFQCQSQISKMDKQLSTELATLKNSLSSLLVLLQGAEGEQVSYVVKSGDSLGQIALDQRTDVKTLKRLNQLATDLIYPGQKLILPAQ